MKYVVCANDIFAPMVTDCLDKFFQSCIDIKD